MHALPGRRRLLQVDGGSVANACWSIGPMDGGKRNHTWDLQPCPWIVNIWQLGALAASNLDVMIPMDSCKYTSNPQSLAMFVPFLTDCLDFWMF